MTRAANPRLHWSWAVTPCAALIALALSASAVVRGQALTWTAPWVRGLDMAWAFRLDGLSLLFGLLISGIGTLVFLYAVPYMAAEARRGRFFFWLTMFMLSMLGLVLADDAVLLFVFWELTSLSSYFLIGYRNEEETSRTAALQALLVTGLGGLALLCGLLMFGSIAGTLRLSGMAAAADIAVHPLSGAAAALVLIGVCTKSAQFPFHFWLPNAMAAPTPVSAYLHSSTMVKAGVYLIARCHPWASAIPFWGPVLSFIGAVTLLTGATLALRERDMKRQLAYLTVGSLGIMTMLLGLGSDKAVQAAVVYLLAHALYKGALFMIVGGVDHATHTRDASALGGLRAAMPVTAAAALAAACSMGALPPSLGYVGKELLLAASWKATPDRLYAVCVYLGGAVMTAVALWVALKPFWGAPSRSASKAHESPVAMLAGPVLLSVAGLLLGLRPGPAHDLTAPAASAILGRPVEIDLGLWHGAHAPFWIGCATLATGALLYAAMVRSGGALIAAGFPGKGPEDLYRAALAALPRAAGTLTVQLQDGRLRHYIRTIVLTIILAGGVSLLMRGPLPDLHWRAAHPFEIGLSLLIAAAALAAVVFSERFAIIAAMGSAAIGITLIFVLYGAPDLAMTQFAVETLAVILLALVLHRLPPRETQRSPLVIRIVDLTIASLLGLLMWALASVAVQGRVDLSASARYFAQTSLTEGHGRNIVNVILVDFRGIDTLGEITVLAVAGIGVYALMKSRASKGGGAEEKGR